MKKSIVKTLSAFLVMVMVLSTLSVAAFAAEFNEHEHTGTCCSDGGVAVLAVSTCPGGEHVYRATMSAVFVDCGGVHRVDEATLYECASCAHSYYETTGRYYYEAHNYTQTLVGFDSDSGLNVYYYECECGNAYYGN